MFAFGIDWQGNLTLATLGFLNLAWVVGTLTDRIYRIKFNRHFRDKAIAKGQIPGDIEDEPESNGCEEDDDDDRDGGNGNFDASSADDEDTPASAESSTQTIIEEPET